MAQEALLEEGARMTVRESAEQVFRAAREPLTTEEIARRILSGGFWRSDGKTPHATVAAQLYTDIKRRGDGLPFVRVGPNTFGLRAERGAAPPEPHRQQHARPEDSQAERQRSQGAKPQDPATGHPGRQRPLRRAPKPLQHLAPKVTGLPERPRPPLNS
jgi:hypothetical protein